MGCVKTISYDKFPEQGPHLNKRVKVCFHYDTTKELLGTIVRYDYEDPGRVIIKLDNGKFLLDTECQYSIIPEGVKE